ncbi:MAG: hypothetical protein ACLTSX_11515 [Collinsella sp.]
MAEKAGVSYWKNQAGAEIAVINVNDAEAEGGRREVVLVKPQSYVNTSGGPISSSARSTRSNSRSCIAIHDELDIHRGDIRVKVGGGHAEPQRPALHHRQARQPRLFAHPRRHRHPRAVCPWPTSS